MTVRSFRSGKEYYISCLAIIIFLSSCSTQLDLGVAKITPAALKGKLKASINTLDPANAFKTEYTYTKEGKIEKILTTYISQNKKSEEVFVLDTDSIITASEEKRTENDKVVLFKKLYKYNKNKWVENIQETNTVTGDIFVDIFYYDGQGKVTEFIRRQALPNGARFVGSGNFIWKEKNISIFEDHSQPGKYEEVDYLYDTKENPLYVLYARHMKIPSKKAEELSVNNVLFMQSLFEATKYKYDYEYNKNNIPAKKILNVYFEGQWKKLGEVTYEYYE